MLDGIIGFSIRIAIMFITAAVFAGAACYFFNNIGFTYKLHYLEAFSALSLIGITRFMWSFEEIV